MSVSRSVVGGFGFVVTEDEIEEYLERVGSPSDYAPFDDFFGYVRSKFPELTAKLVGNQMTAEGLAVLVCAKSTTVDNDDVREEVPGFGLYQVHSGLPLDNDELSSILRLKEAMLGFETTKRFLGYQHGILVL